MSRLLLIVALTLLGACSAPTEPGPPSEPNDAGGWVDTSTVTLQM